MRSDFKLFWIGWGMLAISALTVMLLQVGSQQQLDELTKLKRDIVKSQQYKTELEATFASLTRPEVLRSVVSSVYPNFEPISFTKIVDVEQLPLRGQI